MMKNTSRVKMGGRSLLLGLILMILCISGDGSQEIDTEYPTTTWGEENEILPVSRIQFPKDRKPSGVTKRIIGGNVASPNEYPYQVALYISVDGSFYFCGGTLLTNMWVLTAAHCVDQASSVEVILGAHDISQVESTRVTLNSNTFIIHDEWDETILQNDIALIRLPRNVTMNTYISTVKIAEGTDSYSGIVGRCLGWGRTILGSLSTVLRYVDAQIMTNEDCSSYEDYSSYIVDHHLCTSGAGTVGSCNGDSGGPLMVNGVQVGIVSFGVTDCAAAMPSVFTRVTEFNSWIRENIGNWNGSISESIGDDGDDGSRIVPVLGVYVGLGVCVVLMNYL